jgi:hypothetical protein
MNLAFIQSFSPGTIRTDGTLWAGFQAKVGPKDIVVNALGRWIFIGNSDVHLINLLDANGNPQGQVSLNAAGQPVGSFAWVTLAAPVQLTAGSTFFLMSQETGEPDIWSNDDLVFTTTIDATVLSSAFSVNPTGVPTLHTPGAMYVPVNFQYPGTLPQLPQVMIPT